MIELTKRERLAMIQEGYNPLMPEDIDNFIQRRPPNRETSLMREIAEMSPYHGSKSYTNGNVTYDLGNKSFDKVRQKFGDDFEMEEEFESEFGSETNRSSFSQSTMQNVRGSLKERLMKGGGNNKNQNSRQRVNEDYEENRFSRNDSRLPSLPSKNKSPLANLHEQIAKKQQPTISAAHYNKGKELAIEYGKMFLKAQKGSKAALQEATQINSQINKFSGKLTGLAKTSFDKGVAEIAQKLNKKING